MIQDQLIELNLTIAEVNFVLKALAGGLVADDIYKTATGELRIVF